MVGPDELWDVRARLDVPWMPDKRAIVDVLGPFDAVLQTDRFGEQVIQPVASGLLSGDDVAVDVAMTEQGPAKQVIPQKAGGEAEFHFRLSDSGCGASRPGWDENQ